MNDFQDLLVHKLIFNAENLIVKIKFAFKQKWEFDYPQLV
jgi:hypothetical protein